ncbi:MAG: class I SAM-dependent methyltransferase [Parvibaculaceae bacterium]
MFAILGRLLKRLVRTGDLKLVGPGGQVVRLGDGTGKPVAVRIATETAAAGICLRPDLYFGQCFMDGTLVMEEGSIYDLLAVLLSNVEGHKWPAVIRFAYWMRQLVRYVEQYNPIPQAQRNVAHHYDLSGELYDLFLDRDRQYSCAYFETPDMSLEEAQLAKKRHLAAKLRIEPGMRVLDIGSGWGGLGLYLAEVCGAEVTGVTLSQEQFTCSNQRAQQRGVAGRVKFKLADYRQLDGVFDRIVSVGMFEHVGIGHYRAFFAKIHSLLHENGAAVIHSIARSDGPSATNAWIAKYIFPGGYIPALSEVVPHIERSGLYVTDIEILRLHYAETLKEWRRRFLDHRDRVKALYDERFCRMWEFYLASSESAFRYQGMDNMQIQFTRHQHALPLTRDYIDAAERRLKQIDAKRPLLKSVKSAKSD